MKLGARKVRKKINICIDISADEVLDQLEFVDVLKWYKKELGNEEFGSILREELDLL